MIAVKNNGAMKLIQKRDLSFSYAATDIGTKEGTHFKTLTVVKNVGKHFTEKLHDTKSKDEDNKKLNVKNEEIFEELFSKIFHELPKSSDASSKSEKSEEKMLVPKEEAEKVEEPKEEISEDDKGVKPISEALTDEKGEIKEDEKKKVENKDEQKKEVKKKEDKPEEQLKLKYLFTPEDEHLIEQALKKENQKEIEEFKSKAIELSHAQLSAKAQDKYWKKQKRQSELFSDYLIEKKV